MQNLFFLVISSLLFFPNKTPDSPKPTIKKRPVLIELFTSQGCSSCPPADKVLELISESYPKSEVIAVSFHVDYWNYLGWKDTFGQAKFSERQRHYNGLLNDNTYTPQMVIDAETSLVGSQGRQVHNALNKALKEDLTNELSPTIVLDDNNNNVEIDFNADIQEGDVVQFALVEKKATVDIGRGENRGRVITYHNVVRDFTSSNIPKDKLILKKIDVSEAFILAMIQDEKGQIKYLDYFTL